MARIRGGSNRTSAANSYEEARNQRLDENKKKLQDLGIMSLSKSLSKVIKPVHKSPKLKTKTSKERLDASDVRRSNRSRGSATPYSEEFMMELARSRPRKKSKAKARSMTSLARPLDEVKNASNAQRTYTEKCATTFQSGLTSGHPCFIKSMRHSHVYSGFWLGLPSDFCQNYLPEDDATMVLEGPDGVEHESLYKAMKNGLSAGWRHFALVHKLDDGDALIFELTQPQKFKIFFFRVSEVYRKKKEAKNLKSVAG